MGVHNSGYIQLFSHPVMVRELLTGFVKEDWVADLDMSTLERQNGSYVTDDLREREDDIIWRVKWKNANRWMYIYFLIEFQSKSDAYMALRVTNYLTLLYQDLLHTDSVKKGELLPPVLPMVIYRGEHNWTAEKNLSDLIQKPPGSLRRYLPSMEYLLIDQTRFEPKHLESMSNLVAELFRVEKGPALVDSLAAVMSFVQWIDQSGTPQDSLRRALFAWFSGRQKSGTLLPKEMIQDMDLNEVDTMLETRFEQWEAELLAKGEAKGKAEGEAIGKAKGKAEGEAIGKAKGKAEGKLEGERELFLSLYSKKFGTLSKPHMNQIQSANADDILQLSQKLLTAVSPEDIF